MLRDIFNIKNYPLFLVNMGFLGVAIAVTSPFLIIYMTEEYGISTTVFGLFLAAAALGSFIINTYVGRKSDHITFDRKYIIVAALVSMIIAFMGFVIFENLLIVIVSYILFASLGAPAMPQLYASARESINDYQPRLATFANTVLRSTFSLGFLIGPLIGTILLANFGFDGLFVGTSLFFVTVLILALLIKPRSKPPSERDDVQMNVSVSNQAPSLTKNMYIFLPFIAFIFLQMAMFMYNLNMPLYVTGTLGLDERNVGIIASLCAGLEVPFMIMVGYIAGRYSARNLLIVSGFFAIIYFTLIGTIQDFTWMLIGQVPLSIFLAIMLGLGISYFQELVPQFPGFASTLFANGMIVGQLLGNLLGGMLSDFAGVQSVFYLCTAAVIISMIILFITKPVVKEEAI